MPSTLPPDHGKGKAKAFYRAEATESQQISASLKRLQTEMGGKNLAEYFDGRDGKEVAQSTVSRWISEPGRFPAVFVPVLCELDAEYRAAHIRRVTATDLLSPGLLRAVPEQSREEVRRQLESRFLDMVYGGPNRAGDYT